MLLNNELKLGYIFDYLQKSRRLSQLCPTVSHSALPLNNMALTHH